MIKTTRNRIEWVDVLKFLGIWAIYLGHFGNKAGPAYSFVFTYQVPLFFFVAGFFSPNYLKESPINFLKKKTLQLLVSYLFFGMIALAVYTVQESWGIMQIKDAFLALALGIRNHIFAGSLWFLPCLYIVIVIDYFVMKIFKLRVFSLAASIGLFIVSQTLLPNNPGKNPSWFMNLDSAIFYYIYYSLGAILFPYLNKKSTSTTSQIVIGISIAISFVVTSLVYLLGSGWLFGKITLQIPMISTFGLSYSVFDILIALTIIYFNVFMAKLLSGISFLGKLGRETLIFCGTEDIMKAVFMQLLAMFNLKVNLNTPFKTIAFALICLVASYYTLVKFLNTYFPQAVGKITQQEEQGNDK